MRNGVDNESIVCAISFMYNPVFDSCWKEKSLYPLYLLGYSDFCRCFGL